MIIIAVLILLMIAGVMLSYNATYKIERPDLDDAKEKEKFLKLEAEKQKIIFYSLPKIQTNITSPYQRVMQVELTIALEPSDARLIPEIGTYQAFINDLVISIVSQNTSEELNSVSGKIILAEKIKNGLNEKMRKNAIKRVLFSTFSVQTQ